MANIDYTQEQLEVCAWFLKKVLPQRINVATREDVFNRTYEAGQEQGWNECLQEIVRAAVELDVRIQKEPSMMRLAQSFAAAVGMEPVRVGRATEGEEHYWPSQDEIDRPR